MNNGTTKTEYLKWAKRTLTPEELDSPDQVKVAELIENLYAQGYVFTRTGRGAMNQTRSVRIDLSKFELTSENRRILKRTESILPTKPTIAKIPDETAPNYDWHIHKIGHDFYEQKFGAGIFSANKIKAIVTDPQASSFNSLFKFAANCYCISYISKIPGGILHYSYPFYDLSIAGEAVKDLGLGMMIRAIVWAKENGLAYIYLGSLQRPSDSYKLQFKGLEWFDGTEWKNDINKAKGLF